MQYYDCYFGFYSQKWNEFRNHIEQKFSPLEQLIQLETIWVKSDPTRYACITERNKLVFAAYWDEFGFNHKRYSNDES